MMSFWSPSNDKIEQWQPRGGWSKAFSEKEKIQCTNLFFFYKNKKGLKENVAESAALMDVFKHKYGCAF